LPGEGQGRGAFLSSSRATNVAHDALPDCSLHVFGMDFIGMGYIHEDKTVVGFHGFYSWLVGPSCEFEDERIRGIGARSGTA
jgi:hypothetical protein